MSGDNHPLPRRLAAVITSDGARAAPLAKPYLLTTLTDGRGVAVAVTGDATTAVVEMAVHGGWSARFGDQIATCLRLCLAGPSVTAIIDLHDLEDPLGLSMPFWMAAWRRARFDTSPVDLVLCVPAASALGRRLRAAEGPQLFAGPAPARRRPVPPSPRWCPRPTGSKPGWRPGRIA
ncbi:hypothetical protein AB0J66_11780 [Actinoplanes sp. NPDC049598]|uniref:hypothetical protein n=1 Tax=Actinoplanes sp. NPDC049598 TaxID=3154626 RepID=UPI003429AFAF